MFLAAGESSIRPAGKLFAAWCINGCATNPTVILLGSVLFMRCDTSRVHSSNTVVYGAIIHVISTGRTNGPERFVYSRYSHRIATAPVISAGVLDISSLPLFPAIQRKNKQGQFNDSLLFFVFCFLSPFEKEKTFNAGQNSAHSLLRLFRLSDISVH